MEPFPWKFVIAAIILQLLLVFSAEADDLKDCNLSYTYCAGKLYSEQANQNTAILLGRICGLQQDYTNLLNLDKLPRFFDVVECEHHVAACGYTYMQQYGASLSAWNKVRKLCKENR